MENLRSRIYVRLFSNKKVYLKLTSKATYIPENVFDTDLVPIRKRKAIWKLNKGSYARICILDLSKILMCKFHRNYSENEYGKQKWQESQLLIIGSLMYETKTEDTYQDFSKNKKMFDSSDYSAKSKYYDNLYKLVVGTIKWVVFLLKSFLIKARDVFFCRW